MSKFQNITIVNHDQIHRNVDIVFDQYITSITPKQNMSELDSLGKSPLIEIDESNSHVVYKTEKLLENNGEILIFPGFIDIHIHGVRGRDTMDGNIDSIYTIAKSLLENGTTSFLPTTMTMSTKDIINALNSVREFKQRQENGEFQDCAKVLGAHLEGPFINEKYKGAQPEEYVQRPNLDWILDFTDIIKMVTYAPEFDTDYKFTKKLKSEGEKYDGIVMSIGHTSATFEQAVEAYHNGASHITHCFNACTPLHHRNPGVVGAALTTDYTADFIVDGVHSHKDFIGGFIKARGVHKSMTITDAMSAAMMPNGKYSLGGQEVIVENGAARIASGSLAGSVLTTEKILHNLKEFADFSNTEIATLMSYNPAKLLNKTNIGKIEVGMLADFVVTDSNLNILMIVKSKSNNKPIQR